VLAYKNTSMPGSRTTIRPKGRRERTLKGPPMPPRPVRPGSLERRSEDALLIRSALRGDQAAYKRLMKKYHAALFNLICRLVRNRAEAEDLTQEAFVKAFASLKNFNAEYAFTTWLYKIATNNTIDYIRKRKLDTFSINKPIESDESDYTFELPDVTHQPDRELMQGQKKVMIEEAISRLPEKYRRVIVLRHTEERDYAEIAKLLKLPIGTVKAHIFRARELLYRQLRTKLSQY
jgi:RNA polymerase sigma factor (sigma-70 family)